MISGKKTHSYLFPMWGINYFLAFKCDLLHNWGQKKVAYSLLGLSHMPARTLNDFFAGFFMAISEPIWRVRIRDTDTLFSNLAAV
jgi:hypothetical protein